MTRESEGLGDSVERYNQIPDYVLDGNVLEVGARDGRAQLKSRHAKRFIGKSIVGTYTGVDILEPEESELKLIKFDFFEIIDVNGAYKVDTILALEVLEHLSLRDWKRFFDTAKRLLKPGGILFLTTPYNESMSKTLSWYLPSYDTEPTGGHVVYGITPDVMACFIDGAEYIRRRHRSNWRQDGASWAWAVLRTLKRILTRSPNAWGWRSSHASLITIWRNES